MLGTTPIDQRDTHRLIPAQFADGGASVLTRLTDDPKTLEGIFELDNATNDRLLAESRLSPGIDESANSSSEFLLTELSTLRFAIPRPRDRASIPPIGAHGTHRSSWRRHKRKLPTTASCGFRETAWEEEDTADYLDYLADFRAEFHDLRPSSEHAAAMSSVFRPPVMPPRRRSPPGCSNLAPRESSIPCVRRVGGTCIVCFRPVLVTNVRVKAAFSRSHFPIHTRRRRIRRA